ncbi:protein HOTHEAD-like [Curcuma longa]|uniref:protein HOTHEAD-like n=1 Tax=Curcuma longa TaxID=136217 RepID=UPI003D9E90C8
MALESKRMFISVVAAAIIIFSGICYAQNSSEYGFVKHAADAPRVSYHDYIIVGGGTAGCPLAATLSERFDVLVLERGGSPYGNPNISNLASFVENLAYLTPTSPAQRFVSEDGVFNTRARSLGGGTCINAGFYSRASNRDVMDMGLNPKLADQSFRWVERELVFRPQLTEWTSAFRAGLLAAGVTPDNGFTYEHLEGTKVGGTIFDPTGHRHTAADLLKYADPARITVLLRATAQRILFQNVTGQHKNPQAYGVVYKDETGNIHEARLKGSTGEIILSAGALGSPQLLMLSGVGPADHLKSFGIEVVLDQSMVGHGIADNPLNIFAVPSPEPLTITMPQVAGIRPGYYVETLTGFAAAALLGGNYQGGLIGEKLANPLSRGYLRLKNLDPEDNPSVTYNYFTEPEDLRTCVEALQTVMRVIDTQALSQFRNPNQTVEYLQALTASLVVNNRTRSAQDATSLEQYCRDLVLTLSHFHGGCEVGKVVDHEYRVIGVNGLRVIDGSTFSFSPGTNPQATLMMLGRYMGVLIGNGGVEPSD